MICARATCWHSPARKARPATSIGPIWRAQTKRNENDPLASWRKSLATNTHTLFRFACINPQRIHSNGTSHAADTNNCHSLVSIFCVVFSLNLARTTQNKISIGQKLNPDATKPNAYPRVLLITAPLMSRANVAPGGSVTRRQGALK